MTAKRWWNKSSFLIALFVGLSIAVLGATYLVVSTDRDRQLSAGAQKAGELADFFNAHTRHVIEYADAILRSSRREYSRSGIAGVRNLLADIPPDQQAVSHLTIIDQFGNPMFISGHTPKAGVTAVDRDYFQHHKSGTRDEPYFSLPHEGRNTGKLSLRLARRIEGPNGEFAGVIFAAMPADQFTEFFAALNLGPNSSATLVGLDKRIRARSSYGRLGPGQDISGSQIWQRLDESPSGLYRQTSVVDGITRYYAYRQMSEYPLVNAIGIAVDDVDTSTRRFAIFAFSIAALTILIMGFLIVAYHRRAVYLQKLETEVQVRREAEDEAVRANDIKTTFLATMSHEIRTPINAIMGLFELIEAAAVPDRQKRQAQAGQTAAQDLLKQLVNVLDISRLEARSLDVSMTNEPVAPMLADIKEVLEGAVAQSGKTLKTEISIAEDVPDKIKVDRRRVLQVIINLVDNAVKFTKDGSVGVFVSVKHAIDGNMLKVTVKDTGIGISEDKFETIFQRFGQLDGAITREAGGTGLGLSISKELAELMGGKMTVKSDLGSGSSFSLLLPMNEPT